MCIGTRLEVSARIRTGAQESCPGDQREGAIGLDLQWAWSEPPWNAGSFDVGLATWLFLGDIWALEEQAGKQLLLGA